MSTKGIADVVFCLDASDSMRPCIDGVRDHVVDFVGGLKSSAQVAWDLRADFVAHRAGETERGVVFHQHSLYNDQLLDALYLKSDQSTRFFSNNVEDLKKGLQTVKVFGNEAPLVALDSCLDFPWRDAASCHRVIIFMSDEAFETGVFCDEQKAKLPELVKKIQQLRVMLYIVAPESPVFSELASVDRSEYEVVDTTGDGLSNVDFKKVLSYIGKSVSVSTLQGTKAESVAKGIFGQASWSKTGESITGR